MKRQAQNVARAASASPGPRTAQFAALIGTLHFQPWQATGFMKLDAPAGEQAARLLDEYCSETECARDPMNNSEPDETPAPPSKSRRKRESSALQDIGRALVQLPADRMRKLDLPEPLRDAVLEARRINSHSALRRQMQYIGKLMRDVDAEPIVEQLAAIQGASDVAKARFHALERWRERLLADDDALTELLVRYPHADVQQLRQLIRNSRRETAEGKPPRSSRALFRMLAELQNTDQE